LGGRRIVIGSGGRVYAYLGPDCALTQLTDGHFIFVDPADDSLTPHLIANGYWEQWVEAVLHALVRPGAHVIEVGANLGYYTLKMARDVGPEGRVHSFEANPTVFRLLHRSVRFNGYLDRVGLANAAVSNEAGVLPFTVSRSDAGGGHLWFEGDDLSGDRSRVDIPAVTLDSVYGGPPIDVLRIDAEGSELLIIGGAEALLAASPNVRVCMEWDVLQMRSRCDITVGVDRLRSSGFRFWLIEYDSTLSEVAADSVIDLPHRDLVVCREQPL
jgi:FkbM family methyltransferase